MNRLVAAEALEAPLFEHAQQLGLRDDREVADFVEEQRAFVGQLEAAGLAVVRAGERAFFVAEDFRFEQRVRQRRAVDGLEFRGLSAAQLVNHPRDELLAGAGRTENQHGNVGLRGGADPLEDDQHLLVAADHFAEALDRRRLIFGADRRAPLEEAVEQLLDAGIFRTRRRSIAEACQASRARRRSRRARGCSSRRPSGACRTSASASRRRSFLRAGRSDSEGCRREAGSGPGSGTGCPDRSRSRARGRRRSAG